MKLMLKRRNISRIAEFRVSTTGGRGEESQGLQKLQSRRRCNVNQNTIDWTKSSRRKMKMGFTLRPPQLASAKRQAWSQNDVRWEPYPLWKIDAESGGSGGSWEMLELCSKWGQFSFENSHPRRGTDRWRNVCRSRGLVEKRKMKLLLFLSQAPSFLHLISYYVLLEISNTNYFEVSNTNYFEYELCRN